VKSKEFVVVYAVIFEKHEIARISIHAYCRSCIGRSADTGAFRKEFNLPLKCHLDTRKEMLSQFREKVLLSR
jgi:hypothetical protein